MALSEPFQYLLNEFSDASPPKLPLGMPSVRSTDHVIELEPGSQPHAHRVYRLSPTELEELKSQLETYLAAGQIEPAKSPYGACVLFAKKKDGTMRIYA